MKNSTDIRAKLIFIFIIVMLWIAIFLLLGRGLNSMYSRDLWGLMFIGAALITFFGFLQLPGNVDVNGSFQESRIRFAIAATLIVAYLVYFGSVVYLGPDLDKETGEKLPTFAEDMLPTLTNLLTITISFYFGSTAAIEVADKLSQNKDSSKND